jgi:hypothetical protein
LSCGLNVRSPGRWYRQVVAPLRVVRYGELRQGNQ